MFPPPELPEYDEFGRRIVRPVEAPQAVTQFIGSPSFPPPLPTATGIPITPVPPLPKQAELESMQMPRREDYPRSKARTILSAIAGGLAGAAAGPATGMQVGSALANARYNQAVEDRKRMMEMLAPQVASEKERMRLGEESVKAATQALTARSLDESRRMQAQAALGRVDVAQATLDVKRQEEARKAKLTDISIKAKQWAMNNPNNPYQILGNIDPSDTEAMQAALQQIREVTKVKAEDTAAKVQAKIDVEAKPENVKKIETVSRARGFSGMAGRVAATGTPEALEAERKAAEARKVETPLTQDDIDAANTLIEKVRKNPDSYSDVMKETPAKLKTSVIAGLGKENIMPKNLNADEQKRLITIRTTINHANTILSLIEDPDIRPNLGPIMGRVGVGAQILGSSRLSTVPRPGETESPAQKEARLLTAMTQTVGWEAASLTGGRGGVRIIDYLKQTSPQYKGDYDRIKGNANGLIISAGNQLKAIFNPSSEGKDIGQGTKSKYNVVVK